MCRPNRGRSMDCEPRPRLHRPFRIIETDPWDWVNAVSLTCVGWFMPLGQGIWLDIEAVFAAGINFFDTTDVYGRGAAESAGRDPLKLPARLLHSGNRGVGTVVRESRGPRPVRSPDRKANRRLA